MGRKRNRETVSTRRLAALYGDILRCETCFGAPGCSIEHDQERVRRWVVDTSLASDVFLIGEALGPQTQRKSGVPYQLANGLLSQTGKTLDDFLRRFGYSIDPGSRLKYAYSTDLIQHYPGRTANGDQTPKRQEIENCSEWLRKELELVRPKVVISLGRLAKDFLLRLAAIPDTRLESPWGREFPCAIGAMTVSAFAVPHPSYARYKRDLVERVYAEASKRIARLLGH